MKIIFSMRILLSENSKQFLFNSLKKEHECNSLKELSKYLNIPFKTINDWRYNKDRYIPDKIIPKIFLDKLEILDKKEYNWGSIKGGKKTYRVIINKYGIEEIRRRQSDGGKSAIAINKKKYENINLKMDDPLFLEFYGVLLGDGWIGKYRYKNKITNLIGISGNSRLDREFLLNWKEHIKKCFS